MTASLAARVLLVEDQEPARQGLTTMLAIEPDLEVVGAAGTAEEAVRLNEALRPDLVLIDKAVGEDQAAVRAAPSLKSSSSAVVVLLCTGDALGGRCTCAVPGVDGCVCKDSLPGLADRLRDLLALTPAS